MKEFPSMVELANTLSRKGQHTDADLLRELINDHHGLQFELTTLRTENECMTASLRASMPKSSSPKLRDCGEAGHDQGACGNASCSAPTLTHRTVCILTLAGSIERLSQRMCSAEEAPRVRELIEQQRAAIAWLDRVPGVY